jgi:serine/threonine-protein kinase
VLSKLEHPGIARLYDAGITEAGRPWLAMEIIEGVAIDRHCRERELGVRARLELFLQVAAAIGYAHARLVVHRDLKPSNIMVDGTGRVHVVDFGLAKVLDETVPGQQATQTLARTLTPEYASPEQIRGDTITVASDVYSLGVVLYQLLAGKRPYRVRRESPAALEEAIVEADIPPASSQVADRALARALRGDIDTILAKALRRDVNERYATMEAFASDVERHLHGLPVHARRPSLAYNASRFVRRHRGAVAAAALVGAALLAGAAGTLYQARMAQEQARRAEIQRDRALGELQFAQAAEEFMRFLLSEQSTRPLPAIELLSRAERAASQRYPDDAQVRARMQIIVSQLYSEMREYGRADGVLREARSAAHASGDRDAAAYADCVRGALLFPLGNSKEGMALLDSVISRLEAAGDFQPWVVQACYTERAAMNRQVGDADGAARDARAALAAMERPRPGQEVSRAFLNLYIAYPLIKGGQFGEAIAMFEASMRDLARVGRASTSAGFGITSNYFSLLVHAGQLKRAEEVYEEAMKGLAAEATTTPFNTVYASMLVRAARPAEARAVAEETARLTSSKGDKSGEAHSLLWAALAACELQDFARCESLLERVETILRPVLPASHPTFIIVDTTKAQVSLGRHDSRAAIERLERVTARLADERSPHLVRALSLLALAHEQAGDGPAARDSAARAVAVARAAMSGLRHSEWLGNALLAQARIHARQGDGAKAGEMLKEAREQLAGSIGEDSPAVRQAVLR